MLALAQDEPAEHDRLVEAQGLQFVLNRALVSGLERFLPLSVELCESSRLGVRVRPQGRSCC